MDLLHKIKVQTQNLLEKANQTTGNKDEDLTTAVGNLVSGYGIPSEPILQDKTITENGEYTADDNFDGLGIVTVNVEKGITPTGTIEITENGTHDVTNYASANVNISSIESGGEDYTKYATNIMFADLNLFGKSEIFIDLPNVSRVGGLFQNSSTNKTVEHITLKTKKPLEYANAIFYASSEYVDKTLKHITLYIDTSNVQNIGTVFMNLYELEIIDGNPLYFPKATITSNTFYSCLKLKEVRFVSSSIYVSIAFNYSPLLSDATIQSIIDGLATVETSQTLTLHADVKAKLTEAQLTTITSKNWTLA